MTHKEILRKILIERKIGIQDFALSIGFGKNNYTNTLGKDTYSAKTIQKISEALGIESSVFVAYQDGVDNVMINGVMENSPLYGNPKIIHNEREAYIETINALKQVIAMQKGAIERLTEENLRLKK
jgi:plasmid maintenance system antidote protein VapI